MADICIYCRSKTIVKFGKRGTKQRGGVQRFLCKRCYRIFCKDDGFKWKHYSKGKIVETIEFYVGGGITLRFLSENFKLSKKHNIKMGFRIPGEGRKVHRETGSKNHSEDKSR